MRITRKLGVLVTAPLVAMVGFAALAVTTSGGEAVRADGLRRLVTAGAAAGELAYRLQLERAAAVVELAGGSAESTETYSRCVAVTDQAADSYQRARRELSALPAGTVDLLERVDGQLARLAGVRDEVDSGQGRAPATAFRYRIVIAEAQLDDAEELGGLTPQQFANQATPPVQVRGRDEHSPETPPAARRRPHRRRTRVLPESDGRPCLQQPLLAVRMYSWPEAGHHVTAHR